MEQFYSEYYITYFVPDITEFNNIIKLTDRRFITLKDIQKEYIERDILFFYFNDLITNDMICNNSYIIEHRWFSYKPEQSIETLRLKVI